MDKSSTRKRANSTSIPEVDPRVQEGSMKAATGADRGALCIDSDGKRDCEGLVDKSEVVGRSVRHVSSVELHIGEVGPPGTGAPRAEETAIATAAPAVKPDKSPPVARKYSVNRMRASQPIPH